MCKEINSKFPRKIQLEGSVAIVNNEKELKKVVLNSLYGKSIKEDDVLKRSIEIANKSHVKTNKINEFRSLETIDYIQEIMKIDYLNDEELQILYSACEIIFSTTDMHEFQYYDKYKRNDE